MHHPCVGHHLGRDEPDAEADADAEASSVEDDDADPSPADVAESMEPLEPYTTREVAGLVDIPKRVARRLLNALYDAGNVEKKPPHEEAGRTIWVRNVPHITCTECGHEFMVRIVHPVLASVRYCPRCGARVD